ncbi:MAG: beta-phosphoglucomutase family hydrolase [Phycisphaerae bacterium]
MTHLAALIFDLDGVLTDTAELHRRAWQRLAADEAIPWDPRGNGALRGLPREASLRRLLDGRAIGDARFAELLDRKNGYYLELVEQLGPDDLVRGAAELLAEARAAGVALALASASRNARRVLDRLAAAAWFDVIVDGDAPVRGKPAPDSFEHAARMLCVAAADCVVLEDAPVGLQAARAAGMRCVGVGPDARNEPADWHVGQLSELSLAMLGGVPGAAQGAAPTVSYSSLVPF